MPAIHLAGAAGSRLVTPSDQAVRVQLRTDLDTTFFVEAGAGTGKTNELVERIVELIASGRLVMEELAAITFTDAAAAELRDRVRQKLDQAAAGTGTDEGRAKRCARGAEEIDLAAIQTIHAFAGSLLRAFPIEAGLPPGFTIWGDLEQAIAFKERFRRWLYEEAPAKPECARALSLALQLGLSPANLGAMAERLQDRYDVLGPGSCWPAGELPDAIETSRTVGLTLAGLLPLIALAHDPDHDPLAQQIQLSQPLGRRLREAADPLQGLVALNRFRELGLSSWHGKQQDWDRDGAGVNPVPRIKATIKDLNQFADDTLEAHRAAVLGDVLTGLRDLVLRFSEERRSAGVAMFHDLLTWARDLLRDQPDVRRRAHLRFKAILIDEFQDTDPLQLELAWFLAADPAQATERDWHKLRLVPGRLFVVGDPKQSIYRFRRADMGMYQQALASLGDGKVVKLTQNFRSVEPVLSWVNHHLASEMRAEAGVQPNYVELDARRRKDAGYRHGTYTIGGLVDGKAPVRWLAEADAVARLARRIVAERWLVTDRDSSTRRAEYRDICVLLPTRTNLRRLERAFQREDVPYRVESGSLVLNTPEVRDLLSCLRAVEDPSDQVALVAALRSPGYACSDADLLEWVEAGGRLDYLAAMPENDAGSPVRQALESLRAFHQTRHSRTSAATIEALVADRMLAVQAFDQSRPREAWRRLRYVAAQARRLAGAGQPSLRSALDWLEGLQRETFYDPESAVPEGDEDAVRFMTVHGSKGLEFPIVILSGLGVPRRRPNGPKVLCDHTTGRLELQLNRLFATAGFDGARDDTLDAAEQVRLLYVATTRARDHLILSVFHTKHEMQSPAARILEGLQWAPELCHALAVPEASSPPEERAGPESAISAEEHLRQEARWLEARAGLIARLGRERRFTATSIGGAPLADEDAALPEEMDVEMLPAEAEAPVLFPAGKGSTALGLAVHATLQAVDLASLHGLEALAGAIVTAYGIPNQAGEVERLVRTVAGSSCIQVALQAPRMWREAPVGISHEGALLEGLVDLLVEHQDGTLGVIDYKTDHITPRQVRQRMGHYRLQGGAYAFALERATGKRVTSVEFMFAALGQTVSLPASEIDSLRTEVASRLAGANTLAAAGPLPG